MSCGCQEVTDPEFDGSVPLFDEVARPQVLPHVDFAERLSCLSETQQTADIQQHHTPFSPQATFHFMFIAEGAQPNEKPQCVSEARHVGTVLCKLLLLLGL